MARHYTTTLMLMAYLASQVATVPHAHGASRRNQPCDHNARSHIHVSSFEHVGHSHDDGHTHHYDGDGNHSHPGSSDTNTESDGHDSDAIYLPNDTEVSLPTTNVAAPDSVQRVMSTLDIAAVPAPIANFEYLADAFFPDKCSLSCPLYLALRALRI